MNIEIASTSLEILGRQGRVLKLDFPKPLDELSIRRHRRALRAAQRTMARHERDLNLITMKTHEILAPYFVDDDHTLPVRVLNGLTLAAIVARKAPSDLGELGLEVYERALRDLQGTGVFRQPIAGYQGLEALFADKVAILIEVVAKDRHLRGKLEEVDEVFYTLSTGRRLESRKPSSSLPLSVVSAATAGSSEAAFIQRDPKFEETSRLSLLEQRIGQIASVFSKPTSVTSFSLRQGLVSNQRLTEVGKTDHKKRKRSSGCSYVDYNDKMRSVPNLSAATIKGIASVPGVLEATDASAINYKQLAIDASEHRRNNHIGGPNISAESAEFHVRIFRAIGLTSGDVASLSAENLKALVQKAIELHALAFESDQKVKAA